MKTLFPKQPFTSPFGKYEYLKVPFGLAQAPACFQELMNKVLKDLPFATAYLDDIIMYSKTAEEHLDHLQQVSTNFPMQNYEIEQMSLLYQGNSYIGPCPQHYWHQTTTFQTCSY